MYREVVGIIGFIMLIALIYQPISVQAHVPGPMTLEYDYDLQVLTVNVVHEVENTSTHYISQIIVYKYGYILEMENYNNQSSPYGVTETFDIEADDGDVFTVTAKCILSGEVSKNITITAPMTTESDTLITEQESTWPSGQFLIALFVIGSIITIIIVCIALGDMF